MAGLSVSIREGGTGEIVYSQVGTRRVCGARSEDGSAIAKGTEVVVTRYEKGIAYVRLWSEMSGEDETTAGIDSAASIHGALTMDELGAWRRMNRTLVQDAGLADVAGAADHGAELLAATGIVCPMRMAVHFDANWQPNGYTSREGALELGLGIMVFMLVLFTVGLLIAHALKPAASWPMLVVFYVVLGFCVVRKPFDRQVQSEPAASPFRVDGPRFPSGT